MATKPVPHPPAKRAVLYWIPPRVARQAAMSAEQQENLARLRDELLNS